MTLSLDQLPRVPLLFLPTPLTELKRLSRHLGGPRIFIKRDDLTGLGLGGNKTRKLEFLLGEALRQGCDTVITGGAAQSNHCRQTAAAAAAVGLECHLALGGERPPFPEGNLLLDGLFGAVVHWCGEQKKGERIPEIAETLRSKGRRPYVIPFGGSNATGALGFVAAISELASQIASLNIPLHHLVFSSASGGTHAGIAVGIEVSHLDIEAIGIAIDRAGPGDPPYEAELATIANQVAEKLELPFTFTAGDLRMKYGYLGRGYGVVGPLEREAIQLVAREEGVLLDPVYTGRTMGALIDMIRKKEFASGDTVLFWHTGGIPALFEHARELAESLDLGG